MAAASPSSKAAIICRPRHRAKHPANKQAAITASNCWFSRGAMRNRAAKAMPTAKAAAWRPPRSPSKPLPDNPLPNSPPPDSRQAQTTAVVVAATLTRYQASSDA
jgi:hypothetical protein